MCLPQACCPDANNSIISSDECREGNICCYLEAPFKPCMEGKGLCLPVGCYPNEADTIEVKERYNECATSETCEIVKPTCTMQNSTPTTCGLRGNIHESTDIRANRWEFPWSVAIFRVTTMFGRPFNVFLCGGTLLEDRKIVTTAECVDQERTGQLRVHLGRWDMGARSEECSQVLRVTKIVIHKDYNAMSRKNNIALLLLNSDTIQWFSSVNPVCLPTTAMSGQSDPCYIVGWDTMPTLSVNYLLKFKVKTSKSLQDCQKSVQTNYPSLAYELSPEHGCASVVKPMDKHYPCERVTGSGLVCKSSATAQYYLRGVALSALRNCSLSSINDLFVGVNKYTDWIPAMRCEAVAGTIAEIGGVRRMFGSCLRVTRITRTPHVSLVYPRTIARKAGDLDN
ncbi:hypothetical protein AND_007894 [Anopheles darlingi]|uniref:Peptidase S1 domain-containing protein n=1 Tax=Anopheles darlingi TaxID=43151 RepID=W5JC72_ANODA|nr:hypothetical protein AND_007894 [Anopheles darlingi]